MILEIPEEAAMYKIYAHNKPRHTRAQLRHQMASSMTIVGLTKVIGGLYVVTSDTLSLPGTRVNDASLSDIERLASIVSSGASTYEDVDLLLDEDDCTRRRTVCRCPLTVEARDAVSLPSSEYSEG